MEWTDTHSRIIALAFAKTLGPAQRGAMAFVRCLTPDIVLALAKDTSFEVRDWDVKRVADGNDEKARTVTADRAVEIRETKKDATLLLVDTELSGAGMDGIYSATCEVGEENLLGEALKLVKKELPDEHREYAEKAVRRARTYSRRFSVSQWVQLDFLCRTAESGRHPGTYLYLLGLWPVREPCEARSTTRELKESRMFVDRLLGTEVASIAPARRIEAVSLLASHQQLQELEQFLRTASTKPFLVALEELAEKQDLWVNSLRVGSSGQSIQGVKLVPWRTNSGKIAKWSGLKEKDEESPAELVLSSNPNQTGRYAKLEVRWESVPKELEKDTAEYRVAIVTTMDEEISAREVSHSDKERQKCLFSDGDFLTLSEDTLVSAKVVVSVVSEPEIEPQESEEFMIRFGEPDTQEQGRVGKQVRAFSEGLIELGDRNMVSEIASSTSRIEAEKGFVVLRAPKRGKNFRVFRPPLIEEVEKQWIEKSGAPGRWSVRVRDSGMLAGIPKFERFYPTENHPKALWERVAKASEKLSGRFNALGGGVGQIYDENSQFFDVAKEYVLAWAALFDAGDPELALVNTVEVQSLSNRTIGLIVLPNHPLRVAWFAAYDNLVLQTFFDQHAEAKEIQDELSVLDGSMFPAFLPGLDAGASFVFAETLGFHAVAMVPDSDREPKATVAILARALAGNKIAYAPPTVEEQGARVLGNEIVKYLECHDKSRPLHVNAIRAGDGLTMARALGFVHDHYGKVADDEEETEETRENAPAFVLKLHPSSERHAISGRFISEAREKRRTGAGSVSSDDRWMMESIALPGGINLPKLRWARKNEDPDTDAHLAVVFDMLEPRVNAESGREEDSSVPFHAFGLMSFLNKIYSGSPTPVWRSVLVLPNEGEKHPSDRTHTERLTRLAELVQKLVARNINPKGTFPVMATEMSPEKAAIFQKLHRQCNWVVTLDRNAGIEYFDSPLADKKVYDSYVIDCVPERDDLGCLQLITSTGNLDEVRNLLNDALDQMGLSHSKRNADFLFENLKALSGRLAIRFTGQVAPTSELVALALCHANCRAETPSGKDCWMSLEKGFFVPIDDILDILPRALPKEESRKGVAARADLIYVSVAQKALEFRFVEVKYKKHLSVARNPNTLEDIQNQTGTLRRRWNAWYDREDTCETFRAIRRAKLARVLRFYADKAHRHHLPKERYGSIRAEIDRMVRAGRDYPFSRALKGDRGWVFCPEYLGAAPQEISPEGWGTRVFLFGPSLIPDSGDHLGRKLSPSEGTSPKDKSQSEPTDDAQAKNGDDSPPTSTDVLEGEEDEKEELETGECAVPSIVLGTDAFAGTEVSWPLAVKGNPHLLVAGLPGMGKTTCLLNLCAQMLKADVRPIVFSYHEDIDEKLTSKVPSVRFIDFDGLGFNPLRVTDRGSRMAYLDIAGALRDIFMAIFPELGDVQGDHIRRSIKDSFVEAGWDGEDVSQAVEPEFGRFVEILRSIPKRDKGLRTLLARLEELEDYGFFRLCQSQESLWESDSPTVIRVHRTQNDNLQKAFASLVFYGLYKDMFRRGTRDHITHAIIFDEAHRAAGMKLIPTMAKECRKFGISLVLASQEAKDFDVSVFSAIANYLVLRLTEADAKTLIRNVSNSQQERMLADKVKQMEKFRALFFQEGSSRASELDLLPSE